MGKTILVVDDEVDLRDLLSELLFEEGYKCKVSGSVSDAIKIIEDASRNGTPFDLIMSDFNMLGGSGLELLRKVREKKIFTPFLFLSGEDISTEISTYLSQGVYGYQQKPFRAKEILLKLKQYFK